MLSWTVLALIATRLTVLVADEAVWQPKVGSTWQWQLSSQCENPGYIPVDMSFDVDIYDVDLFFTPNSVINQLHSNGRKVVCYFSAGTWEPWRWDALSFPQEILGNNVDAWHNEKYLDVRNLSAIGPFMESRLDLAQAKGCDGVEADNVDAYQVPAEVSGFAVTRKDQKAFLKFLSREAHKRGLAIALKNDLDLVEELVDWFEWAVNESCNTVGNDVANCSLLLPFVEAGKPVLGVEYLDLGDDLDWNVTYIPRFCPAMNLAGFSWIVKARGLPARPYYSCQLNLLVTDSPQYRGALSQAPSAAEAVGPSPKITRQYIGTTDFEEIEEGSGSGSMCNVGHPWTLALSALLVLSLML